MYKIFDEIIVNSADNLQKDSKMNKIKVKINKKEVSVYNNGKGLPIQIHKKENMQIVELVFGHLLTSSNFDDDEKKITGGRNGLGAKLTNIFSKKFRVETVDSSAKKRLVIEWQNNMDTKSNTEITNCHEEDHTLVTFVPDFKRFKISEFTDDMIKVMQKRVYDLAGILGSKVSVYYNDVKIKANSFEKYVDFYLGVEDIDNKQNLRVRMDKSKRWEVIVALSDMQFK